MVKYFSLIFLLVCLVENGFTQQKVILDTDPASDPDDVGCMAMLHTMASLGECEILAVINSTNQKESPLSISAINQFYNRMAIPVGDYKGYDEKIDASPMTYDYHLAKNYPRSLKNWKDALDGVALYREILATAQDTSITVVIIGTMHNFFALLQSQPDDYSRFNGKNLVKAKVKLVVTMGGNFIDGKGYDRTNWGGADTLCSYTEWSCLKEERNRMCRYVIDNCPAPFMASGWEVGCGDYYNANYGVVRTGHQLRQLDTNHIVRRSYEYHFEKRGETKDISRHSNDQCALHYAIRGEGANYIAYKNGQINLSKTGVCNWNPAINRGQGYIQKNRDKDLIAEEIEALMMGKILQKDLTPPNAPTNLKRKDNGNKTVLTWSAAHDDTEGSWVVGYNIYQNGQKLKMTYGTQFIDKLSNEKEAIYEVRSVNTSGKESIGVYF